MFDRDLEALASPLPGEAPCGPDLSYEAVFGAMLAAGRGTPEREYGDTIIPAEDPDWRELEKHALEVLRRSRDLRAVVQLGRARTAREGWRGAADCLELVAALLDGSWASVHPQLDASEGDDPMERMNAVLELAGEGFLRPLREAPIVDGGRAGRFALRDHLWILGEIPVPDGVTAPDGVALRAACLEAASEHLEAAAQAVRTTKEHFARIEQILADRVHAEQRPELGKLGVLLDKADRMVSSVLAERGLVPGPSGGEGASEDAELATASEPARVETTPGGASMTQAVRSREDVQRLIGLCIDWLRTHEPSSPVPMLLERARRLVAKDFLEILRDVAPDALPAVQQLRGLDSDD